VIIAIAIVIPTFVIAVASVIMFVLWKKYKARQMNTKHLQSTGPVAGVEFRKAELPDRAEGANIAEMYSSNYDNSNQAYELEGPRR
jgi:hypothetical protein